MPKFFEVTPIACRDCGSDELTGHGESDNGKPRFMCLSSGTTFQRSYKQNIRKPGAREKVVEMTLEGNGTRAVARQMIISTNTATRVIRPFSFASHQSGSDIPRKQFLKASRMLLNQFE